MSLTSLTPASLLPFITGNDFTQGNDLIGIIAGELTPYGFVITADVAGTSAISRILTLKHPNSPYSLQFSLSTAAGPVQRMNLNLIGLNGITVLSTTLFAGPSVTGPNSMQGGTIKILSGDNILLLQFTGTSGLTTTFAMLQFSDNLWYTWTLMASITLNGGMMDNVSNTMTNAVLSPTYPVAMDGSFPMVPWCVQMSGSNNVWNIFALGVFSLLSTNFTNGLFYSGGGKNYFHYGNLMFSD